MLLAEEKSEENQHIGIFTTIHKLSKKEPATNETVVKPEIMFEDVTISWGQHSERKGSNNLGEVLTDSMASVESTTKHIQH